MRIRLLLVSIIALGCGGDTMNSGEVASIELGHRNLLLLGAGDTAPIEVIVRDAEGALLDVPLTWEIDDPSVVAIDENGMATALVDAGSTRVRAVAGDLRSLDAFVFPVVMADGAFAFTDAQLVSDPVPVDPSAEPEVGSRFTIELSGEVSATVDAPIVARQDAGVIGRVTAIRGATVEFELAPLPDLFREVDIEIEQPLVDEPTPGMAVEALSLSAGPLSCETDVGLEVDAMLAGSPEVDTSNLRWARRFQLRHSLVPLAGFDVAELRLVGNATATAVVDVLMPNPLPATLKCEITEGIVIPALGPFSKLLAPIVDVGVGVEVKGELSGNDVGLRMSLALQLNDVDLGFQYTSADGFRTFQDVTLESEGTNVEVLTPDLSAVTLDIEAYGYSTETLQLGSQILDLTADYATVRNGVRQNIRDLVVDDLSQLDASTGATSYDAEHVIQLEAGPLAWLSPIYALFRIAGGEPMGDFPTATISESPRGMLEVTPVDPDDIYGEYTAAVDLTNTTYFLIPNLARVDLMHREGDAAWTMLDSIEGDSAVGRYEFSWTPDPDGASEHHFGAMVVSNLLPGVQMEIAPNSIRTVFLEDYPFVVTNVPASNAFGVHVEGSYAYLTDRGANMLRIYDVSSPDSPMMVGSSTVMNPQGIFVSGDRAYVAATSSGLAVYDVTNPEAPAFVGSVMTPFGNARDVHVQGTLAYVADSLGTAAPKGLAVFDVSGAGAPTLLGELSISGANPHGISVSGNYAYISDYNQGLVVINVSNPSMPEEVDNAGFGSAVSIHVEGSFAYVVSDSSQLRVFNVTVPSNPTEVGRLDLDDSGAGRGIFVQGSNAFIGNGGAGFHMVDVANPTRPAHVANLPAGYGGEVYAEGNHAYVAGGGDGLVVIRTGP